jgi:hypothetical protein
MSRTAVAAVVIAIVAAFTAITVSLVHARRPLDRRMSKSFDLVVPKHFGTSAKVRSGGCRRERLYFYQCSAEVHPRRHRVSTVYWRVLLHDDGCWTALLRQPVPSPAVLGTAAPRVATFVGCGA